MDSGTIGTMPATEFKKGRYKTWYRLHPNQSHPDFFGQVMVCANLPNNAFVSKAGEKMSVSEMYRDKGFRETPQALNPDADLVTDDKNQMYLIPKGYELKETAEKTIHGDGKTLLDVIVRRVVKKEVLNEVSTPEVSGYICDTCGKECKNAIGLAGHKRSHAK